MTKTFRRAAVTALAAATAILCVPSFAADRTLFDDFAPLPSDFDWGGFYAGIIGGVGAGHADSWVNNTTSLDLSGPSYGLRLGIDFQSGPYVFGALATARKTNISGDATCFNPIYTCQGAIQSLGAVEARAGIASDKALAYIKGGVAYGYGFGDADPTYLDYYFGEFGWTIGAGMEVALTDNISVFGEYSYVALAEHTAPPGTLNPGATQVKVNTHMIDAGINYRF